MKPHFKPRHSAPGFGRVSVQNTRLSSVTANSVPVPPILKHYRADRVSIGYSIYSKPFEFYKGGKGLCINGEDNYINDERNFVDMIRDLVARLKEYGIQSEYHYGDGFEFVNVPDSRFSISHNPRVEEWVVFSTDGDEILYSNHNVESVIEWIVHVRKSAAV